MIKRIYFDHAATTPVDPEVAEAMNKYLAKDFGNASSMHQFGQEAVKGVDYARDVLAKFLNCDRDEVFFTSGATEANNLAILGLLKNYENKGFKPHIITTQIEHPAVLEPCRELARTGQAEVTYAPVNKAGIVEVSMIEKAIKENTALVSVMYVNNEAGTIQPIREIGQMIERTNKIRLGLNHAGREKPKNPGKKLGRIYFHTDATQAINYLNCDTDYLHVDLLSLSGHKVYGPKGVGALFIRQGVLVKPIIYGGHQERNLRPGTYNTPAIVGLGKAIEIVTRDGEENSKQLKKLQNKLFAGISQSIKNIQINGDRENRVPSNVNISVRGVEGESLLMMLDFAGIAVSTGSACASGSLDPSHVLLAMGIPHEIAHGSLRITLGKENTLAEVNKFLKALPPIVNRLRQIAPKP